MRRIRGQGGRIVEGRNFPTTGRWYVAVGALVVTASLHVAASPAGAGNQSLRTYDLVIRECHRRRRHREAVRALPGHLYRGRLNQRVMATGHSLAARRTIDGSRLIAMPGSVDTHTHLWQHIARAASLRTTADLDPQGLSIGITPSAAEVNEIVSAAAGEALLNGITTVADFASNNFGDWVGEATVSAMRANNIDGALVWRRPAVFLPWQLQDRQIAKLRKAGGDSINIWAGIGPLSFFPVPAVYDGAGVAKRNRMNPTEHSMGISRRPAI